MSNQVNGIPCTDPLKVALADAAGNANDAAHPIYTAPAPGVGNAPSNFKNAGANATLNVKAAAGNVFSLNCHNANAADRYIQLHDTATVPAGAAAPKFSFLVKAGGDTVIGTDYFTDEGCSFAAGIAFAFSTTRDTYTAGTAADQRTEVNYA